MNVPPTIESPLNTLPAVIDAVPLVVVEGARKDVTIEGAQSVKDYVKALREIIKLA